MLNNLKFYQINLGKNSNQQLELMKLADLNQIDIICIQEPYTFNNNAINNNTNYKMLFKSKGTRPKTAIAIKKHLNYLIDDELSDENHLIILLDNIVIVNSYLNLKDKISSASPLLSLTTTIDRDIDKDLIQLNKVIDKFKDRFIIITTDSNSRHTLWGDKISNNRGNDLLEFILQNKLNIINIENPNITFTKQVIEQNSNSFSIRTSAIDLTLTNHLNNYQVKDWSIEDDVIDTDHKLIKFKIKFREREKIIFDDKIIIDYEKSDLNKFNQIFNYNKPKLNSDLNYIIDKFDDAVSKAISSLKTKNLKEISNNSIPWYNEKLFIIQNNIMRIKRKLSKQLNKNKRSFLIDKKIE